MESRDWTGIRIPKELSQWLSDEARRRGVSKNSLMLQALWEMKADVEQREKERTA